VERFDEMYAEFYPILYRVIYRITSNEAVTDDICQEAFIKYHEYIGRLPGGEQDKYWLIRVAKNLAFNYSRRQQREQKALSKLFASDKEEEERSGSADELLAGESIGLVQKALAKLPEKLRAPLILREYGNLNYKEIGKVLGLSESNVKVRIFRARERLAEILKKEDLYVPR
jgi:RNA polymerase sigma factor (sigma-70 family)